MQDLNNLNILLDNLSKKANNLTPILYHTQDALYHKSMDSFEKEEDAFGNAWKPTKTLKNKKFGNKSSKKKILQDTGVLKESIIARNDGVKRVSIGSNLSYAPIHQFGGRAGKGANIPARAYLPVNKEGIPEDLKKNIIYAIKAHFGF